MADIRKAVILAAGLGARMGEAGLEIPKGGLKISDRPIVEESVIKLSRFGIKNIVIVTGHLAEFYETLAQHYGALIHTIHNSQFRTTGNALSLWKARHLIQEDFLLLESDLIYEGRAIGECLVNDERNVMLLSGRTQAGDEVFVTASNGRLISMSKNPADLSGPIAGEFVGIAKISREMFDAMMVETERLFAKDNHQRHNYDSDILVAAAQRIPVACHVVDDLLWAEVDDAAQLERARKIIYPKILKKEGSI